MVDYIQMKSYKILFDYNTKEWSIFVYTADESGHLALNITDPLEYLAIVDLLRNEKPLYWNRDKSVLGTTDEPIGEAES